MQLALGALRDVAAIEERFRTGDGFGWHEHDAGLFDGTERFFRPGTSRTWSTPGCPALDGVVARLAAGGSGRRRRLRARRLDDPDGTGVPALVDFVGTDYHEASIVVARRRAARGRGRRTGSAFDVADAPDLARRPATTCHDVRLPARHGRPGGAARAGPRRSLAADGALMVVEPMAGDRVEDNLNPLGRVFYGASALVCTPCSLAQPGRARARPAGRSGPAHRPAPRRRLRPGPDRHHHPGQPRHRSPPVRPREDISHDHRTTTLDIRR